MTGETTSKSMYQTLTDALGSLVVPLPASGHKPVGTGTSQYKPRTAHQYLILGDRRPSELLSEMLELVHPGEERSRLFAMLFLRRLPAAVRLQLTKDDHEDVRALADKADRCATSIHRHQQLLPVFATTADDTEDNDEQSDFTVAAVGSSRGGRFNQRSRGGQNRSRDGRSGQRPQSSSSSSQQDPSQAQQAKQAGLCRNHFIYGDKTYNCGGNCSWSGN